MRPEGRDVGVSVSIYSGAAEQDTVLSLICRNFDAPPIIISRQRLYVAFLKEVSLIFLNHIVRRVGVVS